MTRTCSASFGSRSPAGSTSCRAEEIFFETRGGRASGSERLMVDSWMHRACLEPSKFYRYTSRYHVQPETAVEFLIRPPRYLPIPHDGDYGKDGTFFRSLRIPIATPRFSEHAVHEQWSDTYIKDLCAISQEWSSECAT